jgi:hypothetical protein
MFRNTLIVLIYHRHKLLDLRKAYHREMPGEYLVQVRAYEGAKREPLGASRLLAA